MMHYQPIFGPSGSFSNGAIYPRRGDNRADRAWSATLPSSILGDGHGKVEEVRIEDSKKLTIAHERVVEANDVTSVVTLPENGLCHAFVPERLTEHVILSITSVAMAVLTL